jgi:hypothetical protein
VLNKKASLNQLLAVYLNAKGDGESTTVSARMLNHTDTTRETECPDSAMGCTIAGQKALTMPRVWEFAH